MRAGRTRAGDDLSHKVKVEGVAQARLALAGDRPAVVGVDLVIDVPAGCLQAVKIASVDQSEGVVLDVGAAGVGEGGRGESRHHATSSQSSPSSDSSSACSAT